MTALRIRRRTIARARRELAARGNADWLDPRVWAVGVQVGQAAGWTRLMTVAAVGVLAVGLAKEWAAHASRDTLSPQ